MIRFLESNGYDVSYMSGGDVDSHGAPAAEPQGLHVQRPRRVLVGQSAGQRRGGARRRRQPGFFSGNEIFWKTRWEPSIDGSNTPDRTLITYKETHFNAPIDPHDPATWTGTWARPAVQPAGRWRESRRTRSPASSSWSTRARPTSRCRRIQPAAALAQHRRRRRWPPARRCTLGAGTGRSATSGTTTPTTASGRPDCSTCPRRRSAASRRSRGLRHRPSAPGTVTHHLTLYQAPSGALVFGAGHGPVVLGPRQHQ